MGSPRFKVRNRKTIKEQKRLARVRERKALQAWKRSRGVQDGNSSTKAKQIKAEKPKVDESKIESEPEKLNTSGSARNVNFSPTQNSVNSQKSVDGVVVQRSKSQTSLAVPQPSDVLSEKRYRIFKCGGKLYQQLCDEDCDDDCEASGKSLTMQRNCNRQFKLDNPKLKVFAPQRPKCPMKMTLGKPYGIQLGALSISSDYFDQNVRGKQAFDSLLVAHGVSFFKRAFSWTQRDIDEIILCGTELYKETKNMSIETLSQLTKGFTFKKQFIQVTVSEPIVVGKMMTVNERSIDLLKGMQKFFSQHKHGILQTPDLDLYIVCCKAFIVFDPRGRSLNGHRCRTGEAALMVFGRLENVYHLILNLSKVDVSCPFKISTIDITQIIKSDYSPESFSAVSGNPLKICRTEDFEVIDEHVAYLRGSIHLSSKIFEPFSAKQSVPTAIMAMVYAKIDPPNSWSTPILDRVLHFGAKFYKDIVGEGVIKNLTIADIPSKFYVGDLYKVGITIVPYLKRSSMQVTRSVCDSSITKDLRYIFESSSFRCLLLQVGNSTFAAWLRVRSEVFYFFDGEQKDVEGKIDRYEGSACLFMAGSLETFCDLIVKRLAVLPQSANATLNIHGLKIAEVTKLTKRQQNCKPSFSIMKKDCIKPVTPEIANAISDSPSTVDSVVPLLTAQQLLKLREKLPDKPLHRQVTNLNSPSLVCCKPRVYDEIINSFDQTPSLIIRGAFPPETVEIIRGVNSEILLKATDEKKIRSEDKIG